MLAYGFWQRRFGGDPQVIGKRITLSGEPYEIMGVVGPELKIESDQPPDVYVPFQLDPDRDDNGHYFTVLGRLKPGVTLAAANAQLQAGDEGYRQRHALPADFPQTGFGVQPLQDAIVAGVQNSLLALVGAQFCAAHRRAAVGAGRGRRGIRRDSRDP